MSRCKPAVCGHTVSIECSFELIDPPAVGVGWASDVGSCWVAIVQEEKALLRCPLVRCTQLLPRRRSIQKLIKALALVKIMGFLLLAAVVGTSVSVAATPHACSCRQHPPGFSSRHSSSHKSSYSFTSLIFLAQLCQCCCNCPSRQLPYLRCAPCSWGKIGGPTDVGISHANL